MSLRIAQLILLLVPGLVWGTSLHDEPLSQRTQRADRVVRARVANVRSYMADNDPRRIFTVTQLEVIETLKGTHLPAVELVQLGGKSGKWELRVTGDAQVAVGEEAVFFLRCAKQDAPERCTLVALGEGKLRIVPGKTKGESDVVLPTQGPRAFKAFAQEIKAVPAEAK